MTRRATRMLCCALALAAAVPAAAAQWPSLFRGVVVADSPLGVRVVSVEESSQAHWADLRPQDIIVRVDDREVHSIDEFAELSNALKGRAVRATLLIFRRGSPRELLLHLYSYPIRSAWGLEFIPEHDLRFADPGIGRDYWMRLGRGFEDAGKPAQALDAYLNALHQDPAAAAAALKASELLCRLSRERMEAGALEEGLGWLRNGLLLMERLFDHPLSDEQLRAIRSQLEQTLHALKGRRASSILN
jgi:hypothetical protein